MNAPAISIRDPEGILQGLPKAKLRNKSEWTQFDSDTLAHFIQVRTQILRSRWTQTGVSFSSQGGELVEHTSPAFEDFVFAAVYIRQLFADRDKLFEKAVKVYNKFVDCEIRSSWMQIQLNAFYATLDSDAVMLPTCTLRELFEAFMYGAGLMHAFPKVGDKKRERFLEVYDQTPRHKLLFSLYTSLGYLMNHVGNAERVIYRDYSNWLIDYGLPAPDTRWHDRLFQIKPNGQK